MTQITLNSAPFSTCGQLPKIGSIAPDFTVTKTDLSEIHLANYTGKKVILNIFPSLDTPTCATAMSKFDKIALEMQDVLILCISHDLPFAQNRFCSAKHIENVLPASVFRHPAFGTTYGVSIVDGPLQGLLARAVIFIDKSGHVAYTELVKEISNEPDYASLLKAVKQ